MASSKKYEMTDLDKEHWAYVGRAVPAEPGPKAEALRKAGFTARIFIRPTGRRSLGILWITPQTPRTKR